MNSFIREKCWLVLGVCLSLITFNAIAIDINISATEVEKLIANDASQSDNFGWDVAVDGNTAVVGAINVDDASFDNTGAVYVYEKIAGAWVQQAKLVDLPARSGANERFGESVAIEGDIIVVGVPNDRNISTPLMQGAAFVFTRGSTGWSNPTVNLLLPVDYASQLHAGYGHSVAINNAVIVVGERFHASTKGASAGAAYIFEMESASWTMKREILPPNVADNQYFGHSVDIDGDKILIGAPTSGGGLGLVYVYSLSIPTLDARILSSSDNAIGDNFGWSVAVSGNFAVVGAGLDDNGAVADTGSITIFEKTTLGWTAGNKLFASNANANDHFAWSVDIAGSNIIVGAPWTDAPPTATGANIGSFYIFSNTDSGWAEVSNVVPAKDGGATVPGVTDIRSAGHSVALDNTSFLVGAHGSQVHDTAQTFQQFAGAATQYQLGYLMPMVGGTITLDGGNLVIVIPPLIAQTLVVVSPFPAPDPVVIQGGLSANYIMGYSFDADGIDFNGATADVTMTVDVTGLSQAQRDALNVYFYNTISGNFEPLPSVAITPGTDEIAFDFNLAHFSSYAVLEADILAADDDGDGVPNSSDQCPDTPAGDIVDTEGCTVLVTEACPCGADWSNHGSYVSCVARNAKSLAGTGVITRSEKGAMIAAAAKSSCGK